MKKLIFLMAIFWMICPDMAQAQTRRTVRKPTTSSSQPSTTKRQEDLRQQHRLDSIEALYNDLKSRYENDQAKAGTTKKDTNGTEYQVARVVLDGSIITIYLRVRNRNDSPTLRFGNLANSIGLIASPFKLNNDTKTYKITDTKDCYVEKGYWREIELGSEYNVKTYPSPKLVDELCVREGHNPDNPIKFENIKITRVE